MATVMATHGLTMEFDGFRAVSNLDLTVAERTIHSVIGPNGAGKSTLFSMLTGHLTPTTGTVVFRGSDVAGLAPNKITPLGLACTFQMTRVFSRMTVSECVQSAVTAQSKKSWWLGGVSREVRARAAGLLERVGLEGLSSSRAASLSHGDQRLLEITMAIATRPKMLLLDEPTAGMSPTETRAAVQFVQELVSDFGLTVLLVEHDMDVVFGISDRISVMSEGSMLAEGSPSEVQRNEEVVKIYLGEDL